MRALARSQPRLILADEVGLGKAVEAGLTLKELRARVMLDRALITTPANLITQWQSELSRKFNENFVYADSSWIREMRESNGPDHNPWASEANQLCSLQ